MQDNVYAKIHLNKPEERFVAQVPHANFKNVLNCLCFFTWTPKAKQSKGNKIEK